MLKYPDAPYECKRGQNWLKFKPKITVDLEIVGFEAGDAGKKNEHRLGRLLCSGIDDGKQIDVAVGGGFSEEQRQEIWNNQDQLLGQIVEVEGDAITKSNDSDTYAIRFPQFIRFRELDGGKI